MSGIPFTNQGTSMANSNDGTKRPIITYKLVHTATGMYYIGAVICLGNIEPFFAREARYGRIGNLPFRELLAQDPRYTLEDIQGGWPDILAAKDHARQLLMNLDEDPLCTNLNTGFPYAGWYTLACKTSGRIYVGAGSMFTFKRDLIRGFLRRHEFPHASLQADWDASDGKDFEWHLYVTGTTQEAMAGASAYLADERIKGNPHVVNPDYKLDDISHGRFLSPTQRAARAKGSLNHVVPRGGDNPVSRRIAINEKEFGTVREASESLGIPAATIYARVLSNSPKFRRWRYIDGKGRPPHAFRDYYHKPPVAYRVYRIIHLPTGKAYVGASSHLNSRHSNHFSMLRAGKHHSPAFQALWNSDPVPEHWKLEATPVETRDEMYRQEQAIADQYFQRSLLLNRSPVTRAPPPYMVRADPTFRERLREANQRIARAHEDRFLEKARERVLAWDADPNASGKEAQASAGKLTSKPVSIYGTLFPTMGIAAKTVGLHVGHLRKRVTSSDPRYAEFYFADKNGSPLPPTSQPSLSAHE